MPGKLTEPRDIISSNSPQGGPVQRGDEFRIWDRTAVRPADGKNDVVEGLQLAGAVHHGWLAMICSIKVVPERGMPTTKIGDCEGSPPPVFALIASDAKIRSMSPNSAEVAFSS